MLCDDTLSSCNFFLPNKHNSAQCSGQGIPFLVEVVV